MCIFWKKCKSRLNVRGSAPRTPVGLRRLWVPLPDSGVVTPAYYYNIVEFVSSTKCGLLPEEKTKITTESVLLLPLPHFSTYFSLQIL